MGLIDRLAERLAKEITKAPLPSGAVTMTEQQMRNVAGMHTGQYGFGTSEALPRDPIWPNIPFAPGLPLVPAAINPPREDGRANPRRYEYQVAHNINITENRLVPFKTLRAAADQIDIIRRCLEVAKAKTLGLDWDIVLSESASEKIIGASGKDHVRAMAEARNKFTPEIDRIRSFWLMPDKANGMNWHEWFNMALEEVLVLDALAVWPQMNVGGDLYGLQILDGSTIKPLLDDRGMRPIPPNPAYQQILYGFPRVEFNAPIEDESEDGKFTSDELTYIVRNRRTWTVYGYSPVERSLAVADIYLRRLQWLRAEYTDGVSPELLMKTDSTFGNSPDLLRGYEDVFNNDLAGQTEQRKRVRLLPNGMEPIQLDGYGEKFKAALDEYLVTSVCGHFGIMPSEIGVTPARGLGGAGFQEGEAESAESIMQVPFSSWISAKITDLCYNYLGMSRELEFKLMPSSRNDDVELAKRSDIQLKNGTITVNEVRSAGGLPLIDSAEADMPMISTGRALYFLSPDGLIDATTVATAPALDSEGNPVEGAENTSQKPVESATDQEGAKAKTEVKSFLKWARKPHNRPFQFEHLEATYAETLNKFMEIRDLDGARWYAERYLGL